MTGLKKIRDDHATLARIFKRLREVIQRPSAPPVIALFDLRRELMSTLLAHLKLEDWALYPQLIDSREPEVARVGRAFQEEMGGLAPAFLAYANTWNADSIGADWARYCQETNAILDALMDRLTRENRELLPLLERLERAG